MAIYEDGTFREAATPTKATAAANVVRDAIQSGRLKPGERLPLPQLAAELKMSYTPLREGLKQLQSEGLVVYQPHLGTTVAPFDSDRASEIYRLRELLEPTASALAAVHASPEQLAESGAILKELDEAVDSEDLDRIPLLNAAFHKSIYRAAGSPILVEFIDRLWNGVPYQAISLVDHAHESSREHASILAALQAGDAEGAKEQMQAHISRGAAAAMAAIESSDAQRA